MEVGEMAFFARRAEALPDFVMEAGKADGFIHVCEQGALVFGSNRRKPTAQRPVVAIRNDGPRVVVLPCTSQDKNGQSDFYELTEQRVMWSRLPDGRKSFARDRYEVVTRTRLQKNPIGAMPQPARIDLLNWLKSRY
jgi:hypothetical protein